MRLRILGTPLKFKWECIPAYNLFAAEVALALLQARCLRGCHYTQASVTSAQFCQTCAVASQSYLHPSTYLPGFKVEGILTVSSAAV